MRQFTPPGIEVMLGVKIPMRDGIVLNATVYRPKDSGPLPVIINLAPYNPDGVHPAAYYFATHGFVFAIVDSRGRGDSEGEFDMPITLPSPHLDGYDLVEWIAQQSWCDGQVAMWGGSFAGANQLHTLKSFPRHLATIVPAASASPRHLHGFVGPIRKNHIARYLVLVSGHTQLNNLFQQSDYWIEKYRELYFNHLPFSQLDRILNYPSQHFQQFISLPLHDPALKNLEWTPEEYRRIKIPILCIGGYYDQTTRGEYLWARDLQRNGAPETVAKHYFVLGPWDHAGTRTTKRDIGGWRFGDACLLDLNELNREWYAWTMKGGPRPSFLQKNIAYYVTGLEQWKYADTLDTISNATQRLYLNSMDGQANDVFHSGRLEAEPPHRSAPDRYVYDPLDTRPAEFDCEELDFKNYITDQREELNLYGAGVVYHSAPLEQEIEISGRVKLVVWLSLDVPDTDFEVILSELQPDGTHMRLSDATLRGRYREGIDAERLIPAGEILRYEFDEFLFFARRIAHGNRLRLVLKAVNTLWKEKNYNGGGVVENESGQDARTAHVTVYHDADHPSFLELPIITI